MALLPGLERAAGERARSDAGPDQAASNEADRQRMLAQVEATHARYRAHNQNFAHAPPVQVLGTSSQAGLTRVRAVLGQLGLAEVSFVEGPSGPRISALNPAGAPALPLPD